jgi:hypothetical protein
MTRISAAANPILCTLFLCIEEPNDASVLLNAYLLLAYLCIIGSLYFMLINTLRLYLCRRCRDYMSPAEIDNHKHHIPPHDYYRHHPKSNAARKRHSQ